LKRYGGKKLGGQNWNFRSLWGHIWKYRIFEVLCVKDMGIDEMLVKIRGGNVKLQAQSEFYSNPRTRPEFWEKSGARMQDVGVAVGFNLKLGLDCNMRKTQGARCKILRIY
jgi:hypothetical protein